MTQIAFRRILVPLENSLASEAILVPLEQVTRGQGRVAIELQAVVRAQGDEMALGGEANAMRAHLAELARRLSGAGVDVTISLERGEPVERILSRIQHTQPDLVAMATHGRQGLSRLVRGSVAETVLRSCPAPMLLTSSGAVRIGERPFRRVLVPLDGSATAKEILPLVTAFAQAYESALVLLWVDDEPPEKAAWRAKMALSAPRQDLEDAGLEVSIEVRAGSAADQILAAVPKLGADLIAMSTHGRGGFDRLRFGSVTESVLRESPCPLLVKRSTAT